MKRSMSIVLLLTMMLTLCACGGRTDGAASAPAPAASAEPTAEPTPEPAAQVDEAAELFVKGDYAAAVPMLAELERSGATAASALLGEALYLGLGGKVDFPRAVSCLESALTAGDVYAGYLLADAADNGNGTRQDKDEAARRYIKFVAAADGLDPSAPSYGSVMTALADCFANGRSVDKKPELAREAADKAASAAGLTPFDCMTLAVLYGGEKLGKADGEKADLLYTQALEGLRTLSDAGNLRAQKLLGDLYLEGKGGLEQDYARALELYLKAGEEGYADAQAQVGYMYQNALGVEADYEQAMEWNNRAAQQGNAQGQAQIGYLYHMGLGVTQNLDEAGRWYTRAKDAGSEWAAGMLEQTEATNPHAAFEFHA